MPKHVKGSEVFITGTTVFRYNLGRKVKLLEWLEPKATLNYHDQMIFNGGESGAWIVRPVEGRTMVAKGPEGLPMIANLALIKDEHLSITFLPDQPALTPQEINDLRELTNNGPMFLLNPLEFKAFEDMLEANPLSENKALQTLLSKPSPWN